MENAEPLICAAVVNVQVVSIAKALLERSVTPPAPPLIFAVYTVEPESVVEGVRVTTLPFTLNVAGIVLLAASFRKKVEAVTVDESIASLKLATTVVV